MTINCLGSGSAYRQQLMRAGRMVHQHIEYARSIGCELILDEIICDEQQGKQLEAHWAKLTRENMS